MTELLTDDSRLVLTFIRDHPGLTRVEINAIPRMNTFDISMALKQLMYYNLVFRDRSHEGPHFKVTYHPG
jgi:hypothetical protein